MAAVSKNDPEYFPLISGQSVGLIEDLPPAGEVVRRLVSEARAVLGIARRASQLLRLC
jgi:NAD(P)H-dependent flavin oxidoreductase YrpB (nitropropane dioxygenase family)